MDLRLIAYFICAFAAYIPAEI